MKLFYFRSEEDANFGDELNPWLWEKLMPSSFFNKNGKETFFGIGTILNVEWHPKFANQSERFIVFGSGCGLGTPPKIDERWKIYFVRGPYTAKVLSIAPELAITDPGILIHLFRDNFKTKKRYQYSYMPHWRSNTTEYFKTVFKGSEVNLIDPREPVDIVLEKISKTEILLSEAMHGAIAADALRVPWIPIQTYGDFSVFKWKDWCSSLSLEYSPIMVKPLNKAKEHLNVSCAGSGNILIKIATHFDAWIFPWRLKRIGMATKPFLSSENVLKDRLGRVLEQLERLKNDYLKDPPLQGEYGKGK